ncbi:GroES-like protein [Marasmius fiardii PR-910]|nr:GroES-like protein [Marasmius fiardii PR-910]
MSSQKVLYLQEKLGEFAVSTRGIPKPGAGELVVKIKGAALNPVDWKIQSYGIIVEKYPAVLGTDIAGDVEELGEGVAGFSKGDRVLLQGFFSNDLAGFQQLTKVSAEIVAKIPGSISYSQAASVPLGLATAAIGLFSENPQGAGLNPTLDKTKKYTGKPAFVFGGSSSVAQYAIQLLKWSGFSPVITYASGNHTEYLKSLGATHVVDRRAITVKDLPAKVKKIAGAPIKTVYDAISLDDTQIASYEILADGGTMVVTLDAAITDPTGNRKIVHVFGNVQPKENRTFGRVLYKNLTKFLEDGTIKPNRIEELPNGLAGIPDGLERIKKGQVGGTKLVALPQKTK